MCETKISHIALTQWFLSPVFIVRYVIVEEWNENIYLSIRRTFFFERKIPDWNSMVKDSNILMPAKRKFLKRKIMKRIARCTPWYSTCYFYYVYKGWFYKIESSYFGEKIVCTWTDFWRLNKVKMCICFCIIYYGWQFFFLNKYQQWC